MPATDTFRTANAATTLAATLAPHQQSRTASEQAPPQQVRHPDDQDPLARRCSWQHPTPTAMMRDNNRPAHRYIDRQPMADGFIPHYGNAEGGTHDTRCCYMDERRLPTLEAQLADSTATTAAVGRRPATVGCCQRTESPRPRNAFGSSLQQESVAVAGCEPVLLRLPPGLGPSLDDRPDREQGDDRDHLAAEDDPVDIHRRSPAQLTVALVPSSILPAWQLMERSIPSFSTIVQNRLMVLARQAPWSATV